MGGSWGSHSDQLSKVFPHSSMFRKDNPVLDLSCRKGQRAFCIVDPYSVVKLMVFIKSLKNNGATDGIAKKIFKKYIYSKISISDSFIFHSVY